MLLNLHFKIFTIQEIQYRNGPHRNIAQLGNYFLSGIVLLLRSTH